MPWWGAILIAVACTFAGFVIDAASGHGELTSIFAVLYVIGCVAAVLAVRQSGIFTAVVQPPLILFVAVPAAYYLFHRNEIAGLKDILINCGYPLIERFLLMFTATVVVLLIGMARWYFGAPGRVRAAAPRSAEGTTAKPAALLAGFGAAFAGLFSRGTKEAPARRPRTADHTASARTPRQRRDPAAEATTRSRTPRTRRPDADEEAAPPRRRGEPPPRRRRPAREADPRSAPREYRTRPREEDWSPRAPEAAPRPRRASRYADAYEPYEPYQPYEPPRRDSYVPPPDTHLPYSNVRYRGDVDGGDGYNDDDENRRYRRPR